MSDDQQAVVEVTPEAPEQATVDLPAASVREAPAPERPKKTRFRYVVREALPHWHIFEERTGRRITPHPLPSQQAAEEAAAVYNQQQAPPV